MSTKEGPHSSDVSCEVSIHACMTSLNTSCYGIKYYAVDQLCVASSNISGRPTLLSHCPTAIHVGQDLNSRFGTHSIATSGSTDSSLMPCLGSDGSGTD